MRNSILVDDEDTWLLETFTWSITDNGYVQTTQRIDGRYKTMKLHHFIVGTPIWDGEVVDHINRNKLDNRRTNLRIVDMVENKRNSDHVEYASCVYNKGSTFFVRFTRNYIEYYLSPFKTEDEAIAARDKFFAEHPELQ